MKRLLVLLLCLMMLISAVACASAPTVGTESTSESRGGSETVVETEEKDEYQHDLPKELKFEGTSVRLFTHDGYRCNIFADETDDLTDSVTEAVYNRILNVEDRLGVEFEVVNMAGWDVSNNVLHESLYANSDDYDMIVGYAATNIALAGESLMVDLSTVNHIDLTKPYWDQNFVRDLSYQDKTFWLTGDVLYNYLGNAYVNFVGKQMWDDWVAPNESRSIYEIVKANEWTYDALLRYSAMATHDVNADSVMDQNDAYGYLCNPGHAADAFLFGFDGSYGEITSDGEIEIVFDQPRVLDIYTKIYTILCNTPSVGGFYDDGACAKIFAENRALVFTMFLGTAFNSLFREMTPDDAYTVVPMPLADDSQKEYTTVAFNGLPLIGVPVTVPTDRLDAMGATLEMLAYEGHKTVYPVYYETALKTKLSRNDESAEMMDLIKANIKTDFVYLWSQHFGNPPISELLKIGINGKRPDLTSLLAAQLPGYRTALENLLEQYCSDAAV